MKKMNNNLYLKRKTLKGAINCVKSLLINFSLDNKVYENYGQEQFDKLQDKFINSSDNSKVNQNKEMLNSFKNWCITYYNFVK